MSIESIQKGHLHSSKAAYRRLCSLKGRALFVKLFAKGRYTRGYPISVKSLAISSPKEDAISFFVICVPKKLAKAVQRNRLRRVLREHLHSRQSSIASNFYIALFPQIRFESLAPLERDLALKRILKKSGLWLPAIANSPPPHS